MRRVKKMTDTHHRKPRSKGGDDSCGNIVTVSKTKHQHFHHLFYEGSPQKIANILNRTWIDPDYELIVVKKEQKEFDGLGIS